MSEPLGTSFGNGRYVAGENDLVIAPARGWAGQMPPLIYCHGATGTASEVQTHPEQMSLLRALAQRYTVMLADLGYDPFGNDTGDTRVEQARARLSSAYGATGPLVIVGASMGTITALNYADAHPENVAAVVGIIPALDIADVYSINPDIRPLIDAAYSPAYNDATHGPTHSPVQFAANLDGELPIALFYASNDTAARPEKVTEFVTARPQTQATSLGALGHTNAAIAAAIPGVLEFIYSL